MLNSKDNKVKTYLRREVVSNKFLSINDYKAMTKQVQDLHEMEQSYLAKDLTQPCVMREDSTPGFVTLN